MVKKKNMHKENYTTDELDNAFQAGKNSAFLHNKMSEETKQQFKTMGEDITQLKVSTTRIETKVDGIIETLKNHIQEESEYRKQQDEFHKMIMEKKAGVWVEKVLIGAGSVIGVSILGALLSLILIK